MSILMSVDSSPTGEFSFTCGYGGDPTVFPSYDEAWTYGSQHAGKCPECAACGLHISPVFDVDESITMSDEKSLKVFAALALPLSLENGIPSWGTVGGGMMLSAAMLGIVQEEQMAEATAGVPGFVNDNDSVLPELYRIADMATAALHMSRHITWG